LLYFVHTVAKKVVGVFVRFHYASTFNRALHLFPAKKSGWTTTACSAITNEGVSACGKLFKNSWN
jgi:hypothetical protein